MAVEEIDRVLLADVFEEGCIGDYILVVGIIREVASCVNCTSSICIVVPNVRVLDIIVAVDGGKKGTINVCIVGCGQKL